MQAKKRDPELEFLEEKVTAIPGIPAVLAGLTFPAVDYKLDLDADGALGSIQVTIAA